MHLVLSGPYEILYTTSVARYLVIWVFTAYNFIGSLDLSCKEEYVRQLLLLCLFKCV